MGKTGLAESFDQLIDYFQYELPLDAKYLLFQVLAPLLIGGLVLHGSVGLLSAIYKLFVPPSAEDLHLYVVGFSASLFTVTDTFDTKLFTIASLTHMILSCLASALHWLRCIKKERNERTK